MQRTLLATLAAGLASTYSSAYASVPFPGEDIPILDTIVVTASRFESQGMGQAISAQVITAEEIRDSSAGTVAEVLDKLGGVHTRINFTGVPDSPLDLRGFGMTGDQNTLVLINGQRVSGMEGNTPAHLSAIPVDAIERIEILRGAGAVLYGGGATGGTINVITRSRTAEGVAGNVSATAGSHGLLDLRGGVGVGKGPWGLNLNLQHYENDNYRDNNRATQDAGSGELRFAVGGDFLALRFSGDRQKARLPGARTEAQLASDPRGASTPNDYLDSDSGAVSLAGEKRLGDVTLALDVAYRGKQADMFADWGAGATSLARTDVEVTTFSPRLLWHTPLGSTDNRFTLGLDWSDWSYANDTLGTGWVSSTAERGEQTHRAVYVRDELSFAGGTRVSVGLRRETVEQSQEERLTPIPLRAVENHLSAHEIALQQDLGAGLSAYGRVGRSFRVANIDENRCYSWALPCSPLLNPQRSRDREVGLEWQGRGAWFRAGLFDMAVSDEIHYMNVGPFLFGSNVNLPPTRHRGLELEGRWTLGDKIDGAARYTRTQARFRQGVFGGVDVTGNDVPLVPRDRLALNLGWQASPMSRLGLNLTYVGRQRYDNDQANLFRPMPAYTVADIKFSHQTGAWRLEAGVNNLFDKAYYSYGIVNGTYTSFNAYPEDRRNAYVSAEYRF